MEMWGSEKDFEKVLQMQHGSASRRLQIGANVVNFEESLNIQIGLESRCTECQETRLLCHRTPVSELQSPRAEGPGVLTGGQQ